MATVARLTEIVAKGQWGSVEYAVLVSRKVPAKKFFDGKRLTERDRAKFVQLFLQMAEHGEVSYKRFKREMGNLFAFRHETSKKQIRFPCFQDGNRWILTHGFIEKGGWPQNEIDRANVIEAEYWKRKQ